MTRVGMRRFVLSAIALLAMSGVLSAQFTPTVTPTPVPTAVPTANIPIATIIGTIASIAETFGFAVTNQTVFFSINGIERPNTGDFIIAPIPQTTTCQIDGLGNLIGANVAYPSCQLPQGAHVVMQIGRTGQGVPLIIPYQTVVDIATLVLAQTDPPAVVSAVAVSGPASAGAVVTNPPTGTIGTSTIAFPQCNVVAITTSTFSLDASTSPCQLVTLSANSTITITNLIGGQTIDVNTIEGSPGTFTATWAVSPGSLTWQNTANPTVQPVLPSIVSGSVAHWRFTANNAGTITYARLEGSSDVMKLGSVGDTSSGRLVFLGSTSGQLTMSVPAAAGSTTFNLPSTNGTANQALITDGSGNTSWSSITQSNVLSGSYTFGLSIPGGGEVLAIKATRNMTIDNCLGSWQAAGGSCTTPASLALVDNTQGTTICTVTSTNSASGGTLSTVSNANINNLDVVSIQVNAESGTCNKGIMSLGATYH